MSEVYLGTHATDRPVSEGCILRVQPFQSVDFSQDAFHLLGYPTGQLRTHWNPMVRILRLQSCQKVVNPLHMIAE